MRDLTRDILELIRLTSTDLPPQVEGRLQATLENEEPGSAARSALEAILKNVQLARENSTPICQDTGTPIFYVVHPASASIVEMKKQIRGAVEAATRQAYLRPNAVQAVTGENSGSNLGDDYFPYIHFQQSENDEFTIELLLKGGGCENVGAQYSLPNSELNAGRDLDGVRKCALDAVYRAQGEGCAPGFLGIAVGGDRGTSYLVSKEAFLRGLQEKNPDAQLAALEDRITSEANLLGIGPMGFGGNTTVLGTKIVSAFRHPASYFVTISYMCWAYRHRKMIISGSRVEYQ